MADLIIWKKLRNRTVFYRRYPKKKILMISKRSFGLLDIDKQEKLVNDIFKTMNYAYNGRYEKFGTHMENYEYMYENIKYYFNFAKKNRYFYYDFFLKKFFNFNHKIYEKNI